MRLLQTVDALGSDVFSYNPNYLGPSRFRVSSGVESHRNPKFGAKLLLGGPKILPSRTPESSD